MNRMSKDEYYLGIALAVAKRSTCLKRRYGAVIVNNDIIIATGYNGSARGEINCCDIGTCNRAGCARYTGYELCPAVHAEQNAIIACDRDKMLGATLYLACEGPKHEGSSAFYEDSSSDVKPCNICTRAIKNAGIKRVVTKGGEVYGFSR